MPLEGHWERQHTPLRRAGRREVRVLAAVAVVLSLAGGITLYAAVIHGSPKRGKGCVEVTAAHSTGGATLHACGREAAHWCRSPASRQGAFARPLRVAC